MFGSGVKKRAELIGEDKALHLKSAPAIHVKQNSKTAVTLEVGFCLFKAGSEAVELSSLVKDAPFYEPSSGEIWSEFRQSDGFLVLQQKQAQAYCSRPY